MKVDELLSRPVLLCGVAGNLLTMALCDGWWSVAGAIGAIVCSVGAMLR